MNIKGTDIIIYFQDRKKIISIWQNYFKKYNIPDCMLYKIKQADTLKNNAWTKEEEEIIKKYGFLLNNKDLRKLLPDHSIENIKHKKYKLKIKLNSEIRSQISKETKRRNEWTINELKILKENESQMVLKELCKFFPNRTKEAVVTKKCQLKRQRCLTLL